jgi:hypothetical protein
MVQCMVAYLVGYGRAMVWYGMVLLLLLLHTPVAYCSLESAQRMGPYKYR